MVLCFKLPTRRNTGNPCYSFPRQANTRSSNFFQDPGNPRLPCASSPYLTQNDAKILSTSIQEHFAHLHTWHLVFPTLQNILNSFLILDALPLTPGSLTLSVLTPLASTHPYGSLAGSSARTTAKEASRTASPLAQGTPARLLLHAPHTHVSRKTQQPKLRSPQECGPGAGRRGRRAAGRRPRSSVPV